jgi:hypothetical protein
VQPALFAAPADEQEIVVEDCVARRLVEARADHRQQLFRILPAGIGYSPPCAAILPGQPGQLDVGAIAGIEIALTVGDEDARPGIVEQVLIFALIDLQPAPQGAFLVERGDQLAGQPIDVVDEAANLRSLVSLRNAQTRTAGGIETVQLVGGRLDGSQDEKEDRGERSCDNQRNLAGQQQTRVIGVAAGPGFDRIPIRLQTDRADRLLRVERGVQQAADCRLAGCK